MRTGAGKLVCAVLQKGFYGKKAVKMEKGDFPGGPKANTHVPNAGDPGLIPGQGN